MIQRIQTVYLLLTVILCFASLFMPVAKYFVDGQVVASFGNFRFVADADLTGIANDVTWPLGTLLILTMLVNMLATMLFHFRMRQLRLAIFSTLLLLGYAALYAFYAWLFLQKVGAADGLQDVSFRLPLAAIFPVVCIIFQILAIRGIRRDEALVRSLDRLR